VDGLAQLARGMAPQALARRPEVAALSGRLAPLLQDSDIAKVKIYSPGGLTIFSTEARQIGEDKSANAGFQSAWRGEVASELTHRDEFSAFEGVRSNLDLVSSYVPVHEGGRLVAIFEVYQEVTKLLAEINQARWRVLGLVAAVLLALFAFQWVVVRRAQAILSAHEAQLETDKRELGVQVLEHSEALALSRDRIEHLSTHDQLTGLPNRALLFDRLDQAARAAGRGREHVAVVLIDLDHFATLNDTSGHEQGDRILLQVAQGLKAVLASGETLARIGGDEFAIVLPGQDPLATRAVLAVEQACERLLQAVRQAYRLPATGLQGSASLGVTLFRGSALGSEELLKQAELAMYRSKAAGRDRATFFDPLMAEQALHRARLEAELRQALREGEFVLHYQPEVEADTGRVAGAEALVRWQHPRRGLLHPGDFIALAEDTGLIVPLGQWVIEAACRQLRQWQGHARLGGLVVAVNVSVQQFCHPEFVAQVTDTLRRTGADARRLQLELTESLFAEDLDLVVATMHRLKALGLSFSLDDFGTGYSSLSYLGRLPLDQLKIDRSFVQQIGQGEQGASLCAAIVSLAHGLRLRVVAEGVETEAQREALTRVYRCDLLQGYLISRPVPAPAFETLVGEAAGVRG
jgi:diguanylate cyclase (GGDEF)-like protein